MTKGIGEKVLGWFVVDEDADANATARADADAKPMKVRARPPETEHTPSDDQLAKVLGLLEALPADASAEVKRTIVAASLEAFGVPIDRILASAEDALATLDARAAEGQQRTRDALEQAEARIAKLTAEIAELRAGAAVQVDAQQELVRKTATEKARIRQALDFFGGPGGPKKTLRLVG